MKVILSLLLGTALLVIVLSFVLVYANTHPPRYSLSVPPSRFQTPYEDVFFVTPDGVTLKGWVVEPPHQEKTMPGIILCHGLGANRSDFTDLAVSLAKRGYVVLAFDFRAHGESGGGRSSLGYHEQKDVMAAFTYLSSRPCIDRRRIGVFGFSLGASAAILAAAESGAFAAVVADSAFTSLKDQARDAINRFYHLPSFPFLPLAVLGYELSFRTSVTNIAPESVIGKLAPSPVLIIAGEGDEMIPAENGRRLFHAAREPKELWTIPVEGHGGTVSAAGNEYAERVGEFFDRHLRR